MLTARDGERSVVLGLEVGADDDVTKRLAPEIVSRVRPTSGVGASTLQIKVVFPVRDRSSASAGLGGRRACRPDRCRVRGSQVARRPSRMGL